MIDRRAFVAAVGVGLLAARERACAQPATKLPVPQSLLARVDRVIDK